MAESLKQTQVFYDGSCPLCLDEIDVYRRQDKEGCLRLVDVSAADAAVPPSLDRKAAMARFHVMSADGRLVSGAAAFVEVWDQLAGWRWAGRIAKLPVIRSALEDGYRFFLVFRPALSRAVGFFTRAKARSDAAP